MAKHSRFGLPTALAALEKVGSHKSLQRMCIKSALRGISSIYNLGDLPLDLAMPILLQIEDGEQLATIELGSPQIANAPEMDHLWRRLINKRFPRWEEKGHPVTDDMPWAEVWNVVSKYDAAIAAAAEEELHRQLVGLDQQKHHTQIMEGRAILPQPGMRRRGGGGGGSSSFTWAAGSRTKITDGKSVMRRARREASQIANARQFYTATGALTVRPGQIKRAPISMINEHRVAQLPDIKILAPRKKSGTLEAPTASSASKEARLLAIKNKTAGTSATRTSTSATTSTTERRPAAQREERPAPMPTTMGQRLLKGRQGKSARPPPRVESSTATTSTAPKPSPSDRTLKTARKTAKIAKTEASGATARPAARPPLFGPRASPPKNPGSSPDKTSRVAPSQPAEASTAPTSRPLKRKAPVDIFMRPKKVAR